MVGLDLDSVVFNLHGRRTETTESPIAKTVEHKDGKGTYISPLFCSRLPKTCQDCLSLPRYITRRKSGDLMKANLRAPYSVQTPRLRRGCSIRRGLAWQVAKSNAPAKERIARQALGYSASGSSRGTAASSCCATSESSSTKGKGFDSDNGATPLRLACRSSSEIG